MSTRKTVLTAISLFVLWLLLSGFYDHGLLLFLGVVSSAVAAVLAARMESAAGWTESARLSVSECVRYAAWLAREVVVANLDVARLVVAPKMPISPTVVTLETRQPNDLSQAIYANSITLTPGTVSVEVSDAQIQVHCLTRSGARALRAGEMERRVRSLNTGN